MIEYGNDNHAKQKFRSLNNLTQKIILYYKAHRVI